VVPPATGPIRRLVSLASVLGAVLAASCGGAPPDGPSVVTFPGSMLGGEGTVLRTQLQRFMQENPGIRVIQRDTPDAADQRHQLYVQWLNAQASEPTSWRRRQWRCWCSSSSVGSCRGSRRGR
jgi:ABC-type glycerol-3-phosphate transport system substrate-binding protein